ncbi:ABC transporter transmembrane domain-containing protein [Hyphomicrobium sp. D-2]|uniref:ABC transporter transmembrane domain-containing protein n=1 Tax=Hyphomicrobium sp. D-2 TaxID=3041621 RepID=UPI0024574219|nr:ABC transporter transmembrane domain-containing protein [Hyphomicrobium sp. D-2]MDH4980808.1 ABC transporter transmembrane domain-containing protein [Hyphomicrobium sp. D-2]
MKKDKKTKNTELPSVAANEVDNASRRPRLRPLAALWPYVARHRGKLTLAAISLVVSALAMLAIPLAVRRVIDMGFGSHDGVLIDRYFAVLILIGFVLAVASAARFYYVNWLGERVVADLRSDVFRHVAELGPAFFERNHSGELMSRLTADTTQIKAMASTSLSQALRSLIMMVGALVMMFVTSVHLSLLVLLAIPLTVLPLIAVGRSVRRLSRRAQDTLAEASAYASENLAASRTMQAFAHEKEAANQYRSAVEVSFEAARERMRARAALTALAMFLVIACIVGILWFGAAAVIDGSMSVGRLSQFVLYAVFAGASFAQVSEIWGEINQSAGAAERLTELLALQPEITSPADPVPLPVPPLGEVALDGVSFAYPGRPDLPALDNVSLCARHGENIAIVGPSGAGKSTIFNLLLRFFDPQQGAVLVDDIDVRRVDLDALRARMALVPQDVALFAGTIADNIRYGSPDASREAVERAAEAAQAAGFIRALPDGYDTRLGERGITLSGGQRQRIAIARAILKDAPILLLDEATSALDTESEALVQRGLERLMTGRTTLVIAHRLSTVQKADRIIVMDKGEIVEQGTHGELIARGGLYARLAEMQFSAEAAE